MALSQELVVGLGLGMMHPTVNPPPFALGDKCDRSGLIAPRSTCGQHFPTYHTILIENTTWGFLNLLEKECNVPPTKLNAGRYEGRYEGRYAGRYMDFLLCGALCI